MGLFAPLLWICTVARGFVPVQMSPLGVLRCAFTALALFQRSGEGTDEAGC